MSFARNKVIDMGTPLGVLPYQRPEGYPIDTPLKLITLGYFQDYDDIERSPSQLALEGNTEVHPGDLKYKDINGDGVIDRADFIRTGYPLVPEIQYGINLSLSYKGFDVGVLFQGSTHVSFDKNWEAMWPFPTETTCTINIGLIGLRKWEMQMPNTPKCTENTKIMKPAPIILCPMEVTYG
ncbi:hypothetical protein NXY31_25795 [Bacteroides salyersiae]|nr:hypothetical protein [Bacteroides salyersiae]